VPYDERLAQRIRDVISRDAEVEERKMFGGIAFMVDSKMVVGIVGDELMVRLGPDAFTEALGQPHVRPMDFTGRPMAGFVFVAPAGTREAALERWIERARAYVATVPVRRRQPRPRRLAGTGAARSPRGRPER
jgi:hypothetical protein